MLLGALVTVPWPITSTTTVVVASERPPALPTPSTNAANSRKTAHHSLLPIRRGAYALGQNGEPRQRPRPAVAIRGRQTERVDARREHVWARDDRAGPCREPVVPGEARPAIDPQLRACGTRRAEMERERPALTGAHGRRRPASEDQRAAGRAGSAAAPAGRPADRVACEGDLERVEARLRNREWTDRRAPGGNGERERCHEPAGAKRADMRSTSPGRLEAEGHLEAGFAPADDRRAAGHERDRCGERPPGRPCEPGRNPLRRVPR